MSCEVSRHAHTIAQAIFVLGVIKVDLQRGFKYTGGGEGPVYCDLRMIQGTHLIQEVVVRAIVESLNIRRGEYDFVAGIATGAIPTSVLVASRIGVGHLSVNPQRETERGKDPISGLMERDLSKKRVLLIEDTVNEGGSLRRGTEMLQALGADVSTTCILTYRTQTDVGAPLFALTTLSDIFDVMRLSSKYSSGQVEALRRWREDPTSWRSGS